MLPEWCCHLGISLYLRIRVNQMLTKCYQNVNPICTSYGKIRWFWSKTANVGNRNWHILAKIVTFIEF